MRRYLGFTLIEVLVVLVLTALVAAWVWPTYQAQVQRARRVQARVVLLDSAQRLERLLATSASGVLPPDVASVLPLFSSGGSYRVSVLVSAEGSGYVLRAEPVAVAQRSDACGTFWLNHLGQQGVSATASGVSADECWGR